MILVGMFDSPFVRRVAVTMNLLELPFEHRNWSVGKDFSLISQFNPLGRVPTLVLDDGEVLIESAAILDHLDETVGPGRALLPESGASRRAALRAMAIAAGAAEKGVQQLYERAFRPEDKRHPPWVERCAGQMHAALAELERIADSRRDGWLVGERMTQADVTVSCVVTFLGAALGVGEPPASGGARSDAPPPRYRGLLALAERCEGLPPFRSVKAAFSPPSPARPS
jgi:glutathione S-transferase